MDEIRAEQTHIKNGNPHRYVCAHTHTDTHKVSKARWRRKEELFLFFEKQKGKNWRRERWKRQKSGKNKERKKERSVKFRRKIPPKS